MTIRMLALLVLLSAGPLAGQDRASFSSAECRVAFQYPAGWTVRADTGETCVYRLRPSDWADRLVEDDSIDLSTVHVHVIPEGVWEAAETWGFERRDEGWVVLGRQGIESPADTISGVGWRGFRGEAEVGCFRMEGGYAGLCGMQKALVGADDWAVLIEAFPRAEDAFEAILGSLRRRE